MVLFLKKIIFFFFLARKQNIHQKLLQDFVLYLSTVLRMVKVSILDVEI